MRGTPTEVGRLQWGARLSIIVFIDSSQPRQSLQPVEDLARILVSLVGFRQVVAQGLDGIVGLIEPDRATPIAVRVVFRIVSGDGGEGNIGRELLSVSQPMADGVELRLCGDAHPQWHIPLTAHLADKAVGAQSAVKEPFRCGIIECIVDLLGKLRSRWSLYLQRLTENGGKLLQQLSVQL